ncbi:MAG: hypothetical protein WKF37_00485 [Bryobacteraceae bacterium]
MSNITVSGADISFTLELPNKPTMKGKFRPEDSTITGVATQAGNDVNFAMKRTGEAKFVAAVSASADAGRGGHLGRDGRHGPTTQVDHQANERCRGTAQAR